MKLHIKPRQENHKWSLYWKCSMATHTFSLDPFDIDVDPDTTTALQLRRKLAETIGMRPEDDLCRLESFVEPWELCMYKGRELEDDKTLADNKVNDDALIVFVRKQLIAEGWKIVQEDDEDSSTEEDDF